MFQVGDRIRYTYWVVPREDGWHYATVLGVMGKDVYFLDHGTYKAATNLGAVAVAHCEKISGPSI